MWTPVRLPPSSSSTCSLHGPQTSGRMLAAQHTHASMRVSMKAAPGCTAHRSPALLSMQRVPSALYGRRGVQHYKARGRRQVAVRADLFEGLNRSLEKAWDIVRRDGKLTPDNIKEPMREIRRALLEADVSLPVVRRFVQRVEQSALGVAVIKGVNPEQQLVRVVYDELAKLMGGSAATLEEPDDGPQVVLMAGLQGTGKTTACGKLALSLKKKGKRVLLAATDVYRPAAIDQLVTLGQRCGVDVFELGTGVPPPEIARQALDKAKAEGYDAVIVDTAGRLQIDEAMMAELKEIKSVTSPTDTLLVVDAMTGQEAAALVKTFNDAVDISGAILTKLDGDSRGGAALSVKEVSGKPIKFVGTGEKLEALEQFYPDRMAQRILGMGDVLTLVERAEEAIKADEAEAALKRIMANKFDFDDFLKQYKMVSSMGTMGQVMKLLPGMGKITEKQMAAAEKQFKKFESMIQSMTSEERQNPDLLATSPSRRRRIARGAGRSEEDVTELIGMFASLRKSMRDMSKMLAMGAASGLAGIPTMDNDELMAATLRDSGPRPIPRGKVRRKKARTALSELAEIRAAG